MLKDNILLLIIRIGKFKLFLNNEIILTEVKMKIKVSNVQDAFGARGSIKMCSVQMVRTKAAEFDHS